ncbi:MAG: DNA starvation/stationary phase protection protein [Planctomycetes bacterium]|nr:DNA starvation/stationary phase protection protein [Planctomycetota bacterium]
MSNDLIKNLRTLTADATVLYQKLRHFHWNVRGKNFFGLHLKFEELYTEWATHIDSFAERSLTVGGRPPVTLKENLELSRLKEQPETLNDKGMVAELISDLNTMVANLGQTIEVAEKAGDRGSVAVLDGVREGQEKTIWMLRAFLEG